jgi:hypothetical protein
MESLFGNPTKSDTWRFVLAIFWPGEVQFEIARRIQRLEFRAVVTARSN